MFFIHYQRGTTRSTPMMDQCACMPLDQSPCKFIVERLEHSHHLTWSLPEERQWKLNQPNIHFCYQAWLTSIDYKKRPWIISMSFKYGKSACPVMISWDTYDPITACKEWNAQERKHTTWQGFIKEIPWLCHLRYNFIHIQIYQAFFSK